MCAIKSESSVEHTLCPRNIASVESGELYFSQTEWKVHPIKKIHLLV